MRRRCPSAREDRRRDRDAHARGRQGLAAPAPRATASTRSTRSTRSRPRGDRRARGARPRVVDGARGGRRPSGSRRPPRPRPTPAAEREAWLDAYRFAFVARYPTLNHPLKREWYDRTRDYFLRAGALDDPPLQAVTVPFEGREGEGAELHFYVARPRGVAAPAGRHDLGRDRHVEGGDAQPRRVPPRPRLRDAPRRHARDRPVAGAREPRRGAAVDAGLRLARPPGRPRRHARRRVRRLVRRLLGDEARVHPSRAPPRRGQLGRRRPHHVHARVAGEVPQRRQLPHGPDGRPRRPLRRRRPSRSTSLAARSSRSSTRACSTSRRLRSCSSTAATTCRTRPTTST